MSFSPAQCPPVQGRDSSTAITTTVVHRGSRTSLGGVFKKKAESELVVIGSVTAPSPFIKLQWRPSSVPSSDWMRLRAHCGFIDISTLATPPEPLARSGAALGTDRPRRSARLHALLFLILSSPPRVKSTPPPLRLPMQNQTRTCSNPIPFRSRSPSFSSLTFSFHLPLLSAAGAPHTPCSVLLCTTRTGAPVATPRDSWPLPP